jgi:hypothetical protein
MSRQLAAGAAVVALLAWGGLSGADARAAAKPCMPRGTKTVDKQSGSRVFTRTGRSRANGLYTATYACRQATGRVFRLGIEYDQDLYSGPVGLIQIAGPFVSWSQEFSDEFDDQSDLSLLNLDTGRKVDVDVTDGPTGWDVDDTALTPNGSLAWIDDVPSARGPRLREVWSLVAGVRTKLDSGAYAEIGTLTLRRTALTWMHRDFLKEATLP